LFQFDGLSWHKYNLPNFSSVRCLKIDNTGKIFVGGYNEFGYFKSNSKGKLTYYSLSKLLSENNIKTMDFIWKIHCLKEEIIFQSFTKAYVYKTIK